MNDFYNTPNTNVSTNGDNFYPSRNIKDINNKIIYTLPKSSYYWNNAIYILKALFQLIKVILGSGLTYKLIEKLCS